jgi:hypothetical protein
MRASNALFGSVNYIRIGYFRQRSTRGADPGRHFRPV